ncbi:uncharacterized protein EAF02_002842 [Botrytis sinoallii]|uniref:uncharacterized protein n=1 Tax=Botrytis sinoallii TaxID=1463999 RepID=UPI0019000E52|nr:uncharacterized protein EAF02_002842 [Botrytis sinoallii]KAF7888301.1 hypothetical protein EAF02_002842 [Botrytis sinoallii]
MSPVQFQIMSDLHLETPSARPSYQHFKIQPECRYLALLGDIGKVIDYEFLAFLEDQLRVFEIVFFVQGNHEAYGTKVKAAVETMLGFQRRMNKNRQEGVEMGRFVFLNRTRFEITDSLTVLGCTLFSHISDEQRQSVSLFCSDFSETLEWDIDAHNASHLEDLIWLNAQVEQITLDEPRRKIVVFTHFSPTMLEAANDPKKLEDSNQVRSAFVTDLSDQICWTSSSVRLWAFGHTHYNCDFVEEGTVKRIVANQKGYKRSEVITFDAAMVVDIEIIETLSQNTLGNAIRFEKYARVSESLKKVRRLLDRWLS